MNKYRSFLLISGLFFSLSFLIFLNFFIFKNSQAFLSSVWFQKSIKTEDLLKKFHQATSSNKKSSEKIKIMIVPGHDDENFGAAFGTIREADLNVDLGERIYQLLLKEKGVEVFLTRDRFGYQKELKKYLQEEAEAITEFQQVQKEEMKKLISQKKIVPYSNIFHNSARPEVVNILYGINKFANDFEFDIVLHLHFNDYPGRTGQNGKYSGFSIYVPEKQFSNAEVSQDFAQKIQEALSFWFAESDLPNESGIVEDQELIAVGAYNTVDMISVLIEYGYIYESQFNNPEIKEIIFDELAQATYLGLKNFLKNSEAEINKFDHFKNYSFSKNLQKNDKGAEVLALQHFLKLQSYYPLNNNLNECPLNGNFGNCTELAIKTFQGDNNLDVTGYLNEETRNFINNFKK